MGYKNLEPHLTDLLRLFHDCGVVLTLRIRLVIGADEGHMIMFVIEAPMALCVVL